MLEHCCASVEAAACLKSKDVVTIVRLSSSLHSKTDRVTSTATNTTANKPTITDLFLNLCHNDTHKVIGIPQILLNQKPGISSSACYINMTIAVNNTKATTGLTQFLK